jgi:putative ribosome biogenesis GTPase RsgA
MAGAFQVVQHSELETLGLVAIRDFLKKRARFLRLDSQNIKADKVNVTPVIVMASIDPELLVNRIDMENIYADSVHDCTDKSVMEYLRSTKERDASATVEYV